MTNKRKAISCFMAMVFAVANSAPSFADPVELRLRNGNLVLKGDLVSTDGNAVVLTSPSFGMMMLEADRFDCSGSGCAKLGRGNSFGIRGSNTVGEALTPALIEAYASKKRLRVEKRVGSNAEEIEMELFSKNGDKVALIDAQSHGSGTSFPALLDRTAEIGASSRPIKDKEKNALQNAGMKVNAHVLALDGMPVIVSPGNPVGELTLEQIAKIFAGEISDWSEVGGAPGAINVYARDRKSGTFDTFKSLVLKPFGLKMSKTAKRYESSVELSDTVTRDPRGIGFIGFAYLRNSKPLAIGTSCGIISKPTEFGVKTEEYALARRLFYYTTEGMSSSHAKGLLKFALSDEAQQVITDTGFINQGIDTLPFSEQADRFATAFTARADDFNLEMMKDLATTLRGAERLSVTFRFEHNSGALELKARQDIQRLGRYLQQEDLAGKQIFLLGFADASGTFDSNTLVSLTRADSVRAALAAAVNGKVDISSMVVKGYSELMPVDCNDSEKGREKNRRVEVWIKG